MKALCQRGADGNCTQCGHALPTRRLRTCPKGPNAHLLRKPPTPGGCEWRGQPTGETALVKCADCCGNVRKKRAVYDCALFGGCVPAASGEIATRGGKVHGCAGCKSRGSVL